MAAALLTAIDMIRCSNCGSDNTPGSQFCRFCGVRFQAPQETYDYQSRRPYSWKTDEYQTQAEARPEPKEYMAPAPFDPQRYGAQPLAHAAPQFMSANYRCPNCMSQLLPIAEKRISTAGWIVFSVLLVFVFPLFWIGLLIKEDVHVCPSCKTKLK